MKITNICIHHAGGIGSNNKASSQHLNAYAVDLGHRQRWNYQSSLGYYGGYNFYIDKDGGLTQFRAIGEETMAQVGHNFDTVSICLAGNFNHGVDTPTNAQIEKMKFVMFGLLEGKHNFKVAPGTEISIGWGNVYPHRVLQPNHTDCNGTSLPDDWGKKYVVEYLNYKLGIAKSLLNLLVTLLAKVRASEGKLGANDRSVCDTL